MIALLVFETHSRNGLVTTCTCYRSFFCRFFLFALVSLLCLLRRSLNFFKDFTTIRSFGNRCNSFQFSILYHACRNIASLFYCSAGSYADGDLWGRLGACRGRKSERGKKFFRRCWRSLDSRVSRVCFRPADGAGTKRTLSTPRRLNKCTPLPLVSQDRADEKFFCQGSVCNRGRGLRGIP